MSEQPTAALLTPPGRGAVATIRFLGDCSRIDEAGLFEAADGRPLADQPVDRICFGHWGRDAAEDVVVCRTSDEALEIHCHGGNAAVRRVLLQLEKLECAIQTWYEMDVATRGLFQAECDHALTQSQTLRTANILHAQASGQLRDALREILETNLKGGEVDPRLYNLVRWSHFGRHLTQPWSVVIAGRPNVGKSSLINALLGYTRAIVFDEPGTTRDVVTAQTAFDGWPVQLADTAGIRDEADELESAGIDKAHEQLASAQAKVVLLDVSRPPHADDVNLVRRFPEAILVAHKADLENVWGADLPQNALPVSSETRDGLHALIARIVRRIVPEEPTPRTPIPVSERQIALLREAALAMKEGRGQQWRSSIEQVLA